MEQKHKVYRVEVRTTNIARNVFEDTDGKYRQCSLGVCYVCTDSPKRIYEIFGDTVVAITALGPGYVL